MKQIGCRYWFVVGRSAIAQRGEIMWTTEFLTRIKVYSETGKSRMVTYLSAKILLVEKW